MGRSRRTGSSSPRHLIPLSAFLALVAFVAILLLVGPSRRPAEPVAPPASGAPAPLPVPGSLDRLTELLAPAAHWHLARAGVPPRWEGRIEGGETLIHWNARMSAAIEALGLEVLDAREELLERRGRQPMQRLTLRLGLAGETTAVVLVETARSAALPPAF